MVSITRILAMAAVLSLAACSKQPSPPVTDGVTDALLASAPEGEWLNYGNDLGEQHYSNLELIDDSNVGELGLAWFADFETARGQEAVPLMHNGVLFLTTAWSMVKAYDARTGALKWSYDPEVPRETLGRACCDAVNRGVALYGDKVYVGTLDGRLVALEQETGNLVFEKFIVPNQRDYTITGAPRIANGLVLLGSGGAEYRARGYLGAYDSQTGEEVWKFHTVPGNPADGFENDAMEAAAKTWAGEWWKFGGGGTVWDAITYDPATGLIYFGTGNAEPWVPSVVGREGDSLYTSSIVAVDAETGEYAWHFQETPEDRWDYDSASPIMTVDLTIDGEKRHVILHAPKNGYFYVLDAKTGKFISGTSYAEQNWTTGIDPVTGRAEINPEARYDVTGKTFSVNPGVMGAHSFQPMSFSPKTGLVYIPINLAAVPLRTEEDWKPTDVGYQNAQDPLWWSTPTAGPMGSDEPAAAMAALIAWDPLAKKEVWRVERSKLGNGGTLATAGNLVLHGTTDGRFEAFDAGKGKPLWSYNTHSSIIAAPMTYAIGGEQYVAVLTGWGGGWGGAAIGGTATRNTSRVLVFKLGAKAELPAPPSLAERVLDPPPFTGTDTQVTRGATIYGRYCYACHGAAAVAGSLNPDLRYSATLSDSNAIKSIIIEGALKHNGMVSFEKALADEDSEAIRHYLIKRPNDDKAAGK
ncbi:MAG: PQQ-dependent dehydrogenase, methanol/ethanol family [Novosphingobium sp.]|nr:PQQ-dependent dehydrogenase, methanol/ethanol family [Novosphingobium sp.]